MTDAPHPHSESPDDPHFWIKFYPHLSGAVQSVLERVYQLGLPQHPGIIHVLFVHRGQDQPQITTFPGRRQIDLRVGMTLPPCRDALKSDPDRKWATNMWDGDPEGKIGAAALRITPAGHILGIVGEHLILEHALAILYLALARSGLISADELTKLEVDGNLTYMVLRARD